MDVAGLTTMLIPAGVRFQDCHFSFLGMVGLMRMVMIAAIINGRQNANHY
jgi:hypothetical protein